MKKNSVHYLDKFNDARELIVSSFYHSYKTNKDNPRVLFTKYQEIQRLLFSSRETLMDNDVTVGLYCNPFFCLGHIQMCILHLLDIPHLVDSYPTLWEGDLSQCELYETVYQIAQSKNISPEMDSYILFLKKHLARLYRGGGVLDGMPTWIHKTKPSRASFIYFIDVFYMLYLIECDIQVHTYIETFALLAPKNIRTRYCYSCILEKVNTFASNRLNLDSVEFDKDTLKEYLAEYICPLGEEVRYGSEHHGVVTKSLQPIIQGRFPFLVTSYLTTFTTGVDKDIFEHCPPEIQNRMILYLFVQLCRRFQFDLNVLIRKDHNILRSKSFIQKINLPIFIFLRKEIHVLYQGIRIHSPDVRESIAFWLLMLSENRFQVDIISSRFNLKPLKHNLGLSKAACEHR